MHNRIFSHIFLVVIGICMGVGIFAANSVRVVAEPIEQVAKINEFIK